MIIQETIYPRIIKNHKSIKVKMKDSMSVLLQTELVFPSGRVNYERTKEDRN